MRRRYLAVAGILAILLGAGFGVGMMLPPSPGITKANFDRIEKGMMISDVEIILGRKANQISPAYGAESEPGYIGHYWVFSTGYLRVGVDECGENAGVINKYLSALPEPETLF